MNLYIFIILSSIISAALLLVGHFLPTRTLDLEKNAPYECGFDPINSARLPFSFRFFLIAILFLIFDLEIALLFPTIPATSFTIGPIITLSTVFIIILAIGLAYEWEQGGLEWAE
uniref:NADH-ubiquinone oxidoreductase chain 3 n=1 Tax=Holothuria fuscogilva TaxID=291927 RepID=A0A8F6HCC7_HOLFS|nr:NADH dehydrogenase subunit 3 [Holothuria fuscogilva]